MAAAFGALLVGLAGAIYIVFEGLFIYPNPILECPPKRTFFSR